MMMILQLPLPPPPLLLLLTTLMEMEKRDSAGVGATLQGQ
jgi:hypothetical protein